MALLFTLPIFFLLLALLAFRRLIQIALHALLDTLPFTFDAPSLQYRHGMLRKISASNGTFCASGDGTLRRLAASIFGCPRDFVTTEPKVIAELCGRQQLANFEVRKDQLAAPGTGHLFIASGTRWQEARKRVMPIFAKKNVDSMAALLHDAVDQALEDGVAENGLPFDFRQCSIVLNAAVLARVVYFTVFPARFLDAFPRELARHGAALLQRKEQAQQCAAQRVPSRWSWWWHMVRNGGACSAVEPDGELSVCAELNARLKAEADAERKADDEAEADTERAEAKLGQVVLEGTMTAAGVETIGHILATVVKLLAHHQSVQDRLRAELSTADETPLLRAVVRETLRLCPISSFASARTCTAPATLKANGAQFAPGDSVVVNVYSMGRDKTIWGADADEFRPERWLDENALSPEWKNYFLPFGTGVRQCPGMQLAMALLKIAVATMVRRYRICAAEKIPEPQLVGIPVCVRFEPLVEHHKRTYG